MLSALESANLKLIRAEKQIDTIRGIIMDFLSDEPSVVTKQPDGSHEFKFVERPPDDISIFAGEVIYQIRSALDHLAFGLVKLNRSGITLPTDWEERCAFPLWVGLPKKPTTFNCFGRTLPGITKDAFTFIEMVQPYNRGDINACLTRIAALSNIDKHRYLTVIKGQAQRRDEATVLYKGMEMVGSSVIRVEDGTKTESPFINAPDVQVVKMHVSGAFHRLCRSAIRRSILASRLSLFKNFCKRVLTKLVESSSRHLISSSINPKYSWPGAPPFVL